MKLIILSIMILSSNLFACDNTRALTQTEKKKFTKMACESFERIYGPWMTVDQSICLKETKMKICENSPGYGTYLYGKLTYNVYRSKDCNFILNAGKIVSADCGDE